MPSNFLTQNRRFIAGCALTVLVFAAYWQVFSAAFINFDDPWYVTENVYVRAGITAETVQWAFTTAHTGNWHPLTWLSHMADIEVFGMESWGHHLTNVLLHAFNSLLVLAVLHRLTGAFGASCCAAVLFAVHPVQVENVAWVAERKTLLSACAWLVATLAYTRYALHNEHRYLYLTGVVMAVGALAKPLIVTLPIALLLLDYWPLRRTTDGGARWFALMREKWMLFAVSAASSIVTLAVQQTTEAIKSVDAYPFWARLANACLAYVAYLRNIVWPVDLAVYYPHQGVNTPVVAAIVAGLALSAVSVATVWWRRRWPHVFVGWFWFVGTLVPTIGLIQVGGQAYADRYLYIPILGILILVVWSIQLAVSAKSPRSTTLVAAVGLAACLLLLATVRQTQFWSDSETLFRRALDVAPSTIAYNNLGEAVQNRGRNEEAAQLFRRSLELGPGNADALNNLGVAELRLGRIDEATTTFRLLLADNPDHAIGHYNLATALLKRNQTEEALDHFRESIALDPTFPSSRFSLGELLLDMGRYEEAGEQFAAILQWRPDYTPARINLGITLAARGENDAAIRHLYEAMRVQPDNSAVRFNLGRALAEAGHPAEAVEHLRAAVRLDPGDSDARYLLALVLHNRGDKEAAIAELEELLRHDPEDFRAREALVSFRSEP